MIPKILHIIWVGDESRQPNQLIQTWVDHHPDWQVMVWGNQDLVGRHWRCQQQIRYWGERDCAAVADIMRWEILQEHGGVCVAADSVCLRPLDEALLELNTFACWVNELVEPGKVSAAYVGCSAGNPLIARVIEDIASTPESDLRDKCFSVGSGRLTATWRSMAYAELTVLPSYCFIPRHPGAPIQRQSGQPFACELWATQLGLLDELSGLDAEQIADRLARSRQSSAGSMPAPSAASALARRGVNVVMLTVRTGRQMEDIVESLVRTASHHPHVRITIADGSMDAEKGNWLTQLAARSNADVRLIFEADIVERMKMAMNDEKEWTLYVSDDDPFTVNYLEEFVRQMDALSPQVVALAPSLYVGKFGDRLLTRQVKPCRQTDAAERLQAWQSQDAVQGVLYYSLIRTPVVREWFEHLLSKPYSPSYADQLLTSLLAARGEIAVVDGCTVLVRDESNWATTEAAVRSDMRFYPRPEMVLLHEAWWVADLVRMLDVGHQPALAQALRPRVLVLLGNMFEMLSARASVVGGGTDLGWRDTLVALKALHSELSRPLEVTQIVRAFQAIEQWADRTESVLLNARAGDSGQVDGVASEHRVAANA